MKIFHCFFLPIKIKIYLIYTLIVLICQHTFSYFFILGVDN
nr:MAG TPA: hypothetical protein [Caudoviricetes sp.]